METTTEGRAMTMEEASTMKQSFLCGEASSNAEEEGAMARALEEKGGEEQSRRVISRGQR